ncbi:hypothetical protein Q1695_009661 [Nippostrongylus brasiliensis]|nr:hypothetical protein Q1695_009661 [Nippostrongylus brasiliensis]
MAAGRLHRITEISFLLEQQPLLCYLYKENIDATFYNIPRGCSMNRSTSRYFSCGFHWKRSSKKRILSQSIGSPSGTAKHTADIYKGAKINDFQATADRTANRQSLKHGYAEGVALFHKDVHYRR